MKNKIKRRLVAFRKFCFFLRQTSVVNNYLSCAHPLRHLFISIPYCNVCDVYIKLSHEPKTKERTTALYSCQGVFADRFIFSLNFPRTRLSQEPNDQSQQTNFCGKGSPKIDRFVKMP